MTISQISNEPLVGTALHEAKETKWISDEMCEKIHALIFQLASYLTDPICNAHEYFRRILVVDALNPLAYAITNVWRKFLLALGMVVWGACALATSLVGVALRALAIYLQVHPFIHVQGDSQDKILPASRTFSLLSWNICCVGGGYAITDGGVMPWSSRIDRVVEKILGANADVVCLYETFDTASAFYISDILQKKGYGHLYFNIGPKVVGVSSGILVASKYKISNPEFTLFPEDTLVGRTKNAAKGVFGFDLETEGKSFARVFSTHLQHSAESAFPTQEEVDCRRKQMEIIVEKVNRIRDECVVVTGDLNLSDEEYQRSSWQSLFEKEDHFDPAKKTWGGDEFCAQLMEIKPSPALNLDHTMVVRGSASSLSTRLVETGFDSKIFQSEALSDHAGLRSEVTIAKIG